MLWGCPHCVIDGRVPNLNCTEHHKNNNKISESQPLIGVPLLFSNRIMKHGISSDSHGTSGNTGPILMRSPDRTSMWISRRWPEITAENVQQRSTTLGWFMLVLLLGWQTQNESSQMMFVLPGWQAANELLNSVPAGLGRKTCSCKLKLLWDGLLPPNKYGSNRPTSWTQAGRMNGPRIVPQMATL